MGERADELRFEYEPDPVEEASDYTDLAAGANPPANYYAGGNAGAEAYYGAPDLGTPSPLTGAQGGLRSPNAAGNVSNVSNASGAANEDTSQIRDNIEQTRHQMGDTIDAIQEKLSPQHLMEEAQQAVRDATIGRAEDVMNDVTDTVQDAGSTILDTIRENPIPSVLAAVGLGWLIFKAVSNAQSNNYDNYPTNYRNNNYRNTNYRGYRQSYATQGYYPEYQSRQPGYSTYHAGQNPVGQATNAVGSAASNVTDKVQDVAGNVADTVQNAAGNVADTAQQLASQAQDQVQEIGYQAEHGMIRARNWLEQTWESNPLALGAAALAAGAIIGGLIPETSMEDRLMGDQRDTLLQKAEDVAQDTVQKVESKAQQALNTVQENATPSQQQGEQSQAKSQTSNGSTKSNATSQASKSAQSASSSTGSSAGSSAGSSKSASGTSGSATGSSTSTSSASQTPPPPTSETSSHTTSAR